MVDSYIGFIPKRWPISELDDVACVNLYPKYG